ncbi:MAG TPA: alanine racemase [Acidobacteriaceae bacterium]|jgi:alanine racemase|nr:alanine racemase [Acidobacteriaceae bacterium]
MTPTRPIWAEISKKKLLHNYEWLRELAGPQTELLAVVKANAYGHGLAACAGALVECGAGWLGVTCVEEGVALRQMCPDSRILIMTGMWHGEADAVIEHRLTPVVWEAVHLSWLEAAAQKQGLGAGQIPVHLEIDTGMSRQGVAPEQLELLLNHFSPGSLLRLEAVMTHFHSPGNEEATRQQEGVLARAVDCITGKELRPQFVSAGSSAAGLQEGTGFVHELAARMGARRLLRPGIGLYGYPPSDEHRSELQPVLSWKTRVVALREIEPGTSVGYDATFIARRRTQLALLPVGYADGLNRLLSNQGWMLVRGQRAPIAGRISMDHAVVDVTEIAGVERGDEVTMIGEQGGKQVTAADMARLCGTIAYEVLCGIGARVPRVLVD